MGRWHSRVPNSFGWFLTNLNPTEEKSSDNFIKIQALCLAHIVREAKATIIGHKWVVVESRNSLQQHSNLKNTCATEGPKSQHT